MKNITLITHGAHGGHGGIDKYVRNIIDVISKTENNFNVNVYSKNKVFFIPNPSDVSFETLRCYQNKHPIKDLFFAMSHGVHRGILKKGKYDERLSVIDQLIKKNPNIRFNIHGAYDKQPIWADEYKNCLLYTSPSPRDS